MLKLGVCGCKCPCWGVGVYFRVCGCRCLCWGGVGAYVEVNGCAGADQGLVVGGDTNPLDGVADQIYVIHFLKPHEIKEILVPYGGRAGIYVRILTSGARGCWYVGRSTMMFSP